MSPKPHSRNQLGGYVGISEEGGLAAIVRSAILAVVYPVGSIYISSDATNPADAFGFGTWEAYAEGRSIVGVDEGDGDFEDAGMTGGAKTVTLTEQQIPAHTHVTRIRAVGLIGTVGVSGATQASNASASDGATAATGGGEAHGNMHPYVTAYVWRRTA